ncbi:MAG TPA: hypothetical protein VGI24_10415 [Solirubrobacteraceae bacterium]|jgi:hypothetical protein
MQTTLGSLPSVEKIDIRYAFLLKGRRPSHKELELPLGDETWAVAFDRGPLSNDFEVSPLMSGWSAPEPQLMETPETVFMSDRVTAEAVSRAARPVIEITDEQAEQLQRARTRRTPRG